MKLINKWFIAKTKLANKMQCNPPKGVTCTQNLHNPYLPSLSKIVKNVMGSYQGFKNRAPLFVHGCSY